MKRKIKTEESSKKARVVKRPAVKKPPLFEPENGKRYWLIKSEPLTRIEAGQDVKFSLEDFSKLDKEPWDGVRNYEARNNLLTMAVGDVCLFYHSNCPKPGIVGLARVVEEAEPDETQFDSKDSHYDAKSKKEEPKWWCPQVSFAGRLSRKVCLAELQQLPEYADLQLIKRGRLSVTPVSASHVHSILELSSQGETNDDLDCKVDRKYIVKTITNIK